MFLIFKHKTAFEYNHDRIIEMKKVISTLKGILQIFVGLSAIISGFLMIAFPDGSLMNLPLSLLHGSPFTDFLFPGIILFLVIGLGHAIAFIMNIKKYKYHETANSIMGIGLMIWIFIQVSLIGGGHWLQYLYFGIGLAENVFSILIFTFKK
jgi:hypothetical protein